MNAHVLYSRHERVGLITLNRPDRLNAFADRMRDELADVIGEATRDDRIGAVVMTGAGRAFCAGADLGRMHDLVSAGDWGTRIGLHPDWGGSYFLPRLIGLGRALELVLTAEMISATEALELGLFNRVVDEPRVVDDTMELAARFAERTMAASPARSRPSEHIKRVSSRHGKRGTR